MMKQSNVKRRKSIAYLIILLSIQLILFVIEECLNIIISAMNQDQEQIYLIANCNIVATTSKILILLGFIYSLFTLKFNSYIRHQFQYLGIFYLLFYVCSLQLLMTKDLRSGMYVCDEYEKKRDNDGKCTQGLKYKGWKTVEFANYILGTNLILLFYIIVLIRGFVQELERSGSHHQPYNLEQSQILKTKKQALIALCLFMLYCICKIVLFIITLIMNENTSTQLLVFSNICYHLIMMILWLKIMINILFDKKLKFNFYGNYIQLIYEISQIRSNIFFSTLAWICAGFTIFGISKCNFKETFKENSINFDTFVLFDCIIMQLIIQMFFQSAYIFLVIEKNCHCCWSDEIQGNNTSNQELNQNQELQTHHASESRKPLNLKSQNCWFCQKGLTNDKNKPTIQLKCDPSHVFHLLCAQKWLETIQKCPICKTEIKNN